jgi:hypothetical protein
MMFRKLLSEEFFAIKGCLLIILMWGDFSLRFEFKAVAEGWSTSIDGYRGKIAAFPPIVDWT